MSPPVGKFLPLHEPAPLGPDGHRDGCRYAYPGRAGSPAFCRSPRTRDLWCERHAELWAAEVRAQGGAVVVPFEAPRVEADAGYFSPERQAARDAERKRVRAEQVARGGGGPLAG